MAGPPLTAPRVKIVDEGGPLGTVENASLSKAGETGSGGGGAACRFL
jgi:hypothetical protein